LTRFNFDALLIAAFMDGWRPETHTFHFAVGEMTLSLEDDTMLGVLSCAGQAMGAIDIPATWQTALLPMPYCPSSTPRAHLDLDPAVQRT
jgi:hypothetical protein